MPLILLATPLRCSAGCGAADLHVLSLTGGDLNSYLKSLLSQAEKDMPAPQADD